jgi:hypothetical protein
MRAAGVVYENVEAAVGDALDLSLAAGDAVLASDIEGQGDQAGGSEVLEDLDAAGRGNDLAASAVELEGQGVADAARGAAAGVSRAPTS